MTQAISPRPDLVDTPWQGCPGLRAGAIDSAASMIVMEVLIDALSRLPEGRAALGEAYARRVAQQADDTIGSTPVELAAGALALALIGAAQAVDDGRLAAA